MANQMTKHGPIGRLDGLDSIRFVCAAIVFMSHGGLPPIVEGIDKSTRTGWLVNGVVGNFWNGSAAVIVFFVISGICIHYPYARCLEIDCLRSYFSRRLLRVAIPMSAAMIISPLFGVNLSLLSFSILWSLFAELIYYAIYPILLALRNAVGSWIPIIVASFLISIALAFAEPKIGNYLSFGCYMNWLLALPCWLLGCLLAEKAITNSSRNPSGIGWARTLVWATSVLLSILRAHTPLGYPWTLNWFALLAAYWIDKEIVYFRHKKPNVTTEWLGKWSYSIYLMHMLALHSFDGFGLPNLGHFLNWLLLVIVTGFLSYAFYVVVESPSHHFARWVSSKLKIAETNLCKE